MFFRRKPKPIKPKDSGKVPELPNEKPRKRFEIFKTRPHPKFHNLPEEILAIVVSHLDFYSYTNLVKVSKQFLAIFDTTHMFQAMWEGNFSELCRAYEIPESEESLMRGGWRSLITRSEEVHKEILKVTESLSRRRNTHGSVNNLKERDYWTTYYTDPLVARFSCDKRYFIPLVLLLHSYWDVLKTKVRQRKQWCRISHWCLSQSLVHLQGVRMGLDYFQQAQASQTKNIEECLFELSRCSYNFIHVAVDRLVVLKVIGKAVSSLNPLKNGALIFASTEDLEDLLCRIGKKVLAVIVNHSRMYESQRWCLPGHFRRSNDSAMHKCAIFGKILTEEVFKYPVFIGLKKWTSTVKCGKDFIGIGNKKYGLAEDLKSWVVSSLASNTKFLDYQKAVRACKLPVETKSVWYSESPTLWNLTVDGVIETLLSNPKGSTSELIGNVRYDTKYIESKMKETQGTFTITQEYSADRIILGRGSISAWQFPSPVILGKQEDTFIVRPVDNVVCGRRNLLNTACFPVDRDTILHYLQYRGVNYAGIADFDHLRYDKGFAFDDLIGKEYDIEMM